MRATALLVGVMVCGAAASAVTSQPRPQAAAAIDDLPAAALQALVRQAGVAPLGEFQSEMLHGVAVYSAEWLSDGKSREATVTAAGDLVVLEESIAPEAVPAAVRKAAAARLGTGAAIRYERVTLVLYEAEAEVNGKDREVMLSATGRVPAAEQADDQDVNLQADDNDDDGDDELDDEVEDEDEEEFADDVDEEISLLDVPKKVIKAARGAVKGIALMEAEKRTSREGVVYALVGRTREMEYEIVVTAKGKVVQVFEDED